MFVLTNILYIIHMFIFKNHRFYLNLFGTMSFILSSAKHWFWFGYIYFLPIRTKQAARFGKIYIVFSRVLYLRVDFLTPELHGAQNVEKKSKTDIWSFKKMCKNTHVYTGGYCISVNFHDEYGLYKKHHEHL